MTYLSQILGYLTFQNPWYVTYISVMVLTFVIWLILEGIDRNAQIHAKWNPELHRTDWMGLYYIIGYIFFWPIAYCIIIGIILWGLVNFFTGEDVVDRMIKSQSTRNGPWKDSF